MASHRRYHSAIAITTNLPITTSLKPPHMQITVLYFARLKESLKYSTEQLQLPAGVDTVAALMQHLASRGDAWQAMFSGQQAIRAAINHALVGTEAVIKAGDEVAFFPPVTGG